MKFRGEISSENVDFNYYKVTTPTKIGL